MSDLWPHYAVLEYSRPGVNPVRVRRESYEGTVGRPS
jgi:hypothetical protein